MLKSWRRLLTFKLLAPSALGLAAIVAFVAIGFWHRRQLESAQEGHANRGPSDGDLMRRLSPCEASVPSRMPSEAMAHIAMASSLAARSVTRTNTESNV